MRSDDKEIERVAGCWVTRKWLCLSMRLLCTLRYTLAITVQYAEN